MEMAKSSQASIAHKNYLLNRKFSTKSLKWT